MFGGSRKSEEETPAPSKGATLIAANTRVVGDIHFSDQLMVNGEVEGNVYADSGSAATLTVSAKGGVTGEIRAPNVLINGRVQGDVYADKQVELASEARVQGNVYYNLIEMVKGARVDGNLVYQSAGGEAEGNARKSGSEPRSPAEAGSGAPGGGGAAAGQAPAAAREAGARPQDSDAAGGASDPKDTTDATDATDATKVGKARS